MSNQRLLEFVRKEGPALSAEALTMLYREFLRRRLKTDMIAVVRWRRINRKVGSENVVWYYKGTEFFEKCKMQRRAGATWQEITEGLAKYGYETDYSYLLLEQLEKNDLEQEMLEQERRHARQERRHARKEEWKKHSWDVNAMLVVVLSSALLVMVEIEAEAGFNVIMATVATALLVFIIMLRK